MIFLLTKPKHKILGDIVSEHFFFSFFFFGHRHTEIFYPYCFQNTYIKINLFCLYGFLLVILMLKDQYFFTFFFTFFLHFFYIYYLCFFMIPIRFMGEHCAIVAWGSVEGLPAISPSVQ